MSRKYNFYAGPAVLPREVMEKAQSELLNLNGINLSILEISHRSKDFDDIIQGAEAKIRSLMGVSDDYAVLFLQGGASMQFGMVPMNFLKAGTADYVNTGAWAKKAIKEANLFGKVHVAGSSEDKGFSYIPTNLEFSQGAAYVHITSNETIGGIQWKEYPNTGQTPLMADMSSDIMCREIDVDRFGLIYAGAQKNIGPAGVTLVILRRDLLGRIADGLTTMLDYRTHVDKGSMYNTPPCFAVYVVKLMMEWVEAQGGVAAVERVNRRKAALVYDTIDADDFYRGTARKEDRSIMNVTFRLPSEELEALFVKEATASGLMGLKGHRSVGGCRASIYNSMTLEGVEVLVDFMRSFRKKHG
ncbi:MAG TPA: 3-phosphoserine/phosphohydroxythreonine transaminase [Candidatus Aminicenantes bacterium]|nr:3-phosphoserine/phosphohydroxythreonine transaminase [Candidatus Aminicenantes bacterium]